MTVMPERYVTGRLMYMGERERERERETHTHQHGYTQTAKPVHDGKILTLLTPNLLFSISTK